MSGTFRDVGPPGRNGPDPRRLDDLPRGLVAPPSEIVAQVARDRAQFAPEVYTDAYAKRVLDDATLAYYYEGLDVAYRSVPNGIEVLAVGPEEIGRLVRGKTQEDLLTFTIAEP